MPHGPRAKHHLSYRPVANEMMTPGQWRDRHVNPGGWWSTFGVLAKVQLYHPQCKQHQWSFGRKSMNLRNFQSLLWITTFRSPGFALDHTFHVYSLWGPIINYINKKYKGLLVQSLIDFNAMKAHNTPRFATVMARNTIYKSVSYTPFVVSYNPIVLTTKNWNF
jgi:hypothetical protein